MILDAFDIKFLQNNVNFILNAISESSDTEIMAYYLKTLDHVICSDPKNSPSPA